MPLKSLLLDKIKLSSSLKDIISTLKIHAHSSCPQDRVAFNDLIFLFYNFPDWDDNKIIDYSKNYPVVAANIFNCLVRRHEQKNCPILAIAIDLIITKREYASNRGLRIA